MEISAFRLLLGVVLLLAGRRFFWLSVALIGFLAGAELATVWLAGQPVWLGLVLAAAAGLIGAVLAVLVERIAIGLVGFYAGGYAGIVLASLVGVPQLVLAAFFAGAVLGAFLAVIATNPAIIVLTSLAGAAAIVGTFDWPPTGAAVAFAISVAIGIVVQSAVPAPSASAG